MVLRHHFLSALLLWAATAAAQEKSFTIEGRMPLPDGYNAALSCHTDTAFATIVAEDWVKDGRFTLKGNIDKPYQGTLMTNNLALVERNHWPTDSIRWTYTEVFVTPDSLQFGVCPSPSALLSSPATIPAASATGEQMFALTGTQTQADYNTLQRMGGERGDSLWQFIDRHPASVISTWLACQLTERAYNLTAGQVAHLEQTVKGSPADPARFALLQKKLAMAKKTVKDAPVTDLELTDTAGRTCHLTDILPRNGKYVLIDFWASWCGICIHAMPEIAKLATQYSDRFCVIGISIDTKSDAWHRAMVKHPEPWPQYCTTRQGYRDLFDKYQVGNGVPYYLWVSPQGKVICSPEGPGEIQQLLEIED